MNYRRAFVPGGAYFFTVVTNTRRPLFSEGATVGLLRDAFRHVKRKYPFEIVASVVLPDHLHCIWALPEGDDDFSTRWRLIKTWFSKRSGVGQPLWQNRFWEHLIRDDQDFVRHVEYIHYNPVKHGYVTAPADWPYSSFRKFVQAGDYPIDWGADGVPDYDGVGRE